MIVTRDQTRPDEFAYIVVGSDGRRYSGVMLGSGSVIPTDDWEYELPIAVQDIIWERYEIDARTHNEALKRRPLGWTHPSDELSLSFQRVRASDRTQKSATFVSDALGVVDRESDIEK